MSIIQIFLKTCSHCNCISLRYSVSIFGVSEHSSLRSMEVEWKFQCISLKNNCSVIIQNPARLCSVKEVIKFTASVFKLHVSRFSERNLQNLGSMLSRTSNMHMCERSICIQPGHYMSNSHRSAHNATRPSHISKRTL